MIDEDHGNILIKLGYAFDVKTQRNLILRNQVSLMKVSKNKFLSDKPSRGTLYSWIFCFCFPISLPKRVK